jgi:ribosome-binding factor A
MNESRRQKKVSSLLKGVLSRHLLEDIQDTSTGLISITEIHMTKDLRTAHVYLSMFQTEHKDQVLEMINKKAGYFRKVIASKTKLKYNPKLIFLHDPKIAYENTLDQLIDKIKNEQQND